MLFCELKVNLMQATVTSWIHSDDILSVFLLILVEVAVSQENYSLTVPG